MSQIMFWKESTQKQEELTRFDFIEELGKLLQPTVWHRINATDTLDASARQRAEAFLRTIEKWEEPKND